MDIVDQNPTILLVKKTAKRVVLVGTNSVLDEGIRSLVKSQPEFQVATVACVDLATFLSDVAHIFPDVIVLSEVSPLGWTRTSELIHDISPQQTVRVIVARPDDNTLDVYDKRSFNVTRKDDLIALIRNCQDGA